MEFTAEDDEPLVVYLVVQSSKNARQPAPGKRPAAGGMARGRKGDAAEELGRRLRAPDANHGGPTRRRPHRRRRRCHRPRAAGRLAGAAPGIVRVGRRCAEGRRRGGPRTLPLVPTSWHRSAANRAPAPAMWDGDAENELLLIRGNPKTPGDEVPRAFLAALAADDASPPPTSGSGRLELAQRMTDPGRNPFITRVIVNRVWHHLFGRGIVGSVDNFGVLGQQPTHPAVAGPPGHTICRGRLVDQAADSQAGSHQHLPHVEPACGGREPRPGKLAVASHADSAAAGRSDSRRHSPYLRPTWTTSSRAPACRST